MGSKDPAHPLHLQIRKNNRSSTRLGSGRPSGVTMPALPGVSLALLVTTPASKRCQIGLTFLYLSNVTSTLPRLHQTTGTVWVAERVRIALWINFSHLTLVEPGSSYKAVPRRCTGGQDAGAHTAPQCLVSSQRDPGSPVQDMSAGLRCTELSVCYLLRF